MKHQSHVPCPDCGQKHGPGTKAECIEGLLARIADLEAQLAGQKRESDWQEHKARHARWQNNALRRNRY